MVDFGINADLGPLLLHDGSNIAAVIVEPVAGSAGVIPPPAGYLERLREICDEHGILLIFDEVIAAFGRLGHAFGAQRFGVTPDIITYSMGCFLCANHFRNNLAASRLTTILVSKSSPAPNPRYS